MGYESWSPELQGSAQSRPISLGPEHAGTMVRTGKHKPAISRDFFADWVPVNLSHSKARVGSRRPADDGLSMYP